ncbi:MAG: phenylalanine--tRNA ligase subunit beta, partial [Magnetococcus sp. WYHC-3]
GAELPGGLKIKAAKLRGVASAGMLCSEKELGLATESQGILILPAEAPLGVPVLRALERDDDIYEVSLTPNRGDCLGVRGIARDLHAITGEPLRPLQVAVTVDPEVARQHPVTVEMQSPRGCPRYAGRVIAGVRIAPSPPWLVARLEAAGLRAINNVVDITNYVMLDLGQPLHAFDLDTLALPLVVRGARSGETLVTLDGVTRTLAEDMTLIADQRRPLALAGIMGGEQSGVSEQTETLFLESAWFDPVRTARTGRALGLLSDSRYRFERGVDPQGLVTALDRATALIVALAGGRAGPVVLADTATLQPVPPIPFRHRRVGELGGVELPVATVDDMLERLGCVKCGSSGEHVLFQPPSARHDLRLEEDLVEEVIRLHGYEKVPTVFPRGIMAPRPVPGDMALGDCIRRILCSRGFLETLNYSFIGPALQGRFEPALTPEPLCNPISDDLSVLRTSLIPGLVDAARRNLSRGNARLRLCELGRVFLPRGPGELDEPQRLALLLLGDAERPFWQGGSRKVDFYDLKGEVEALLAGLGVVGVRFEAGGPEFLHPGQRARVLAGDGRIPLGWLGALHPAQAAALDVTPTPLLAEFHLDRIAGMERHPLTAEDPVSRFPAVERDFAFVVHRQLSAAALLECLAAVDATLVREVRVFDVYTGEHVAPHQKSLALRVVLRAPDRTLTEAEVQSLGEAMVQRAREQFGALLRDG